MNSMTTLRSLTLAASFAVAAPIAVQAQAAQPTAAEAAFRRADANSDGKLSKEKAARYPAIATKFDELDKDSFLSMQEFMPGFETPK
jgi:hypothetical protein